MHYHAEVWIPKDGDPKLVEQQVSIAMAPYNEEIDDTEHRTKHLWDWWQIGGRWTGAHDKFNPEDDPANTERCDLCNGTGLRMDAVGVQARRQDPKYTCNGCNGKGERVKWPTEWATHGADILHVSEVPPDLNCHTLLLAETEPIVRDKWDGHAIVKTDFDGKVKAELERRHVTEGYIVTVDYHD